ncbi:hypothetical protein [Dactylosporangium sp. NPDC051541]|uniref:hypothetical protein n=1 Tax=Dactylosporangium sp. NPDC051541 TaxID=3363977 RepID=UPI0037AE7060
MAQTLNVVLTDPDEAGEQDLEICDTDSFLLVRAPQDLRDDVRDDVRHDLRGDLRDDLRGDLRGDLRDHLLDLRHRGGSTAGSPLG